MVSHLLLVFRPILNVEFLIMHNLGHQNCGCTIILKYRQSTRKLHNMKIQRLYLEKEEKSLNQPTGCVYLMDSKSQIIFFLIRYNSLRSADTFFVWYYFSLEKPMKQLSALLRCGPFFFFAQIRAGLPVVVKQVFGWGAWNEKCFQEWKVSEFFQCTNVYLSKFAPKICPKNSLNNPEDSFYMFPHSMGNLAF